MSTASRPRVLIVAGQSQAAALEQGLREHAEIIGSERQPALAIVEARAHKPDLCLVFLDDDAEAQLELTRQLRAEGLTTPIVVSADKRPDNILRAMRAGARDFAHFDGAPGGPGAADALRAIREFQHAQASVRPPRISKLISVFACKGGAGATTIATNLAHAIATTGANGERPEVVLVDFDTVLGDVGVMLDMKPAFGFRDLLDNMQRLDADLIRNSLARHESGFWVLAGAGQADPMAECTSEDLERMLAFLATHFDYIVVDGLHDFHEHALVALDRADSVLCVMTQDLPALKNASRALKLFESLGYPERKLSLVVNRYRNSGKLTVETIAEALHRNVDATVHNDFAAVIKCVNEGALVCERDPGSKVSKDLRTLAGIYHQASPEKRRGLFSLWGKS